MRKHILLYLLTIGLIFLPILANAQTNEDYYCAPIFTSGTITPNILIILDNSRSMNNMAYGYDAQDYYHPDDFNPATEYYGYFNPHLKYTYDGRFEVDAGGGWDGNFLNWLTMRRVDLAKKVLVGGKCTSAVCTGPQKLGGEVPGGNVSEYKFFKFSRNSDAYTPAQFGDDCIFKVSYGKFEVFRIDDPAAFWGAYDAADYKMYNCDEIDFDKDGKTSYLDHEEINYNGHHAFFEGYLFKYLGNQGDGLLNATGHYYDIYEDTGAGGGCDYVPASGEFTKYDESAPINKLLYTTKADAEYETTFNIEVYKEPAVEPEEFLTIDGKVTIVGVLDRIVERENARFGLEYFYTGDKTELGNNKDGGEIKSPITKKMKEDLISKDMKTDIRNQSCEAFCPLAEAFNVAVHYFRQDYDPYKAINGSGSFTINATNDPFNYDGDYPGCGKNFVLLITDGESTMDNNIPDIPAGIRDYDEDFNDTPGTPANAYGTDYLDDLALWAHTEDMRTGAQDIPGDQVINLYTVFVFGSGSQLLKDASKNGGFTDKNDNSVPDLDSEWDEDGDTIPDNYFEAQDGTDLQAQLFAAINAILQRAASGTAVSILSTSSEGEGSLFQAFFKPLVFDNLREVHWTGYLNALWVDPYGNLREETVADNALVYEEDKIIKFEVNEESGDTVISRYHDNDGDGMPDSETPYETASLSSLDPMWEAGEKLAKKNASDRRIYTFVDYNDDGIVDVGEFIEFKESNASILRPFLDPDPDTDEEAANIINFIRGESGTTGYRDRNITIEGTEYVWKLGDIVYSTPTVVGEPMERYNLYYGDTSYKQFFEKWENRGVTVYVGANDGMLHGFKAGTFNEGDNPVTDDGDPNTNHDEEHGWYSATEDPPTTEALGDERWAYIPYHLLPHLKWLKEPDYKHVYYVDLKPKVTDVKTFTADANHPEGWGTILIGGMRLGGGEYTVSGRDFDGDSNIDPDRTFRSAYFALDITVPDSPVLLGEITDPNLNLGFTTSYPAIARVANQDGSQVKWYFIMGSGPTSCDGSSNQNGYVFVVDLNNGSGQLELVQTFPTVENKAFMANPITMDINLNYSTDVIYIGETYDSGSWEGKMYRINTSTDKNSWSYQYNNPGNWGMKNLFSTANAINPITASATASIDEDGHVWVYFGTGRYYNSTDKTDNTPQYFYGIKDPCYDSGTLASPNPCPFGGCADADKVDFNDTDLYNSTEIVVLTSGEVVGATANNWYEFVKEVQAKKGWYVKLQNPLEADAAKRYGERVLNRPSILGGVLLFAPFKPEGDICGYGGEGSLYALYYETGSAYPEDILGTENYGLMGDKKSMARIALDKGITSEIGLHVGQKATSTGFVQQGTGSMVQLEVDPALRVKSGIVGWKQY